jgi:hypothetical protein
MAAAATTTAPTTSSPQEGAAGRPRVCGSLHESGDLDGALAAATGSAAVIAKPPGTG